MAAPMRRAAPVISTTRSVSSALMAGSMTAERDADETAREAEARAALGAAIDGAGGWLDFERAMDLLLYSPGLGYYTGGARKFGAGGDFTTAPELSPLFAQGLATGVAPVLRETGGDVLEIGAGSGALAADLLAALAAEGALPARYRILELSAELRERQRERLARLPATLASRVEFVHAPPDSSWRGVLVANEVLDALPVRRFVCRDGRVFDRGVTMGADGAPSWADRPMSPAHADEVRRLLGGEDLPDDYESEWCPRMAAWLRAVTEQLTQGVALFADYGLPRHEYYHPTRERGTLRCHYRHRAHDDPWVHLATQDITAWVDFTRVAESADECGLDVLGYTTQAAFLLATGIEARVAAVDDVRSRAQLAHAARRLMMPDEMGETFKLIALGRGWDAPLAAFSCGTCDPGCEALTVKLSILDLAHIPQGSDAGTALRNTLDFARLADALGYERFWLAEHHNMPGIASAATSVLIGQVAAVTQRLRVGAGGIMLPNHSPLVIAEQFGTLESLFPGRIDLGLGRAPGTDGLTWRALRRDPSAAERFPDDVVELQALLGPVRAGSAPARHSRRGHERAVVDPRLEPVRRAARRAPGTALRLRFALRARRARRCAARVPRALRALCSACAAVCDAGLQRHRRGHRRRGAPSVDVAAAGGHRPRHRQPGPPGSAGRSTAGSAASGAAARRRIPRLHVRGLAAHRARGARSVRDAHAGG